MLFLNLAVGFYVSIFLRRIFFRGLLRNKWSLLDHFTAALHPVGISVITSD